MQPLLSALQSLLNIRTSSIGMYCQYHDSDTSINMASETTCCCSLQTGSRIVAIVFIICSSLAAIASLVFIVLVAQVVQDYPLLSYQIALATFVIILVICLVYIVLNSILLSAANNNDYGKARTWMIGSSILFAIRVILLCLFLFSPSVDSLARVLIDVSALVFNVYAFWVVGRFMNELKRSGTGEGTRLT